MTHEKFTPPPLPPELILNGEHFEEISRLEWEGSCDPGLRILTSNNTRYFRRKASENPHSIIENHIALADLQRQVKELRERAQVHAGLLGEDSQQLKKLDDRLAKLEGKPRENKQLVDNLQHIKSFFPTGCKEIAQINEAIKELSHE